MTTPYIQAVIFDFDGVVADSEPLHLRLFQRVLAERGIDLTREAYYSRYLHLDDAGLFEAVHNDTGKPLSAEESRRLVLRKEEIFMEEALHGEGAVRLFPNVASLIRDIHATGIPLAVASGALANEIEAILEHHGLIECFDAIVGARECTHHKPHPEPYERAFDHLNRNGRIRKTNTLAIEDSVGGLNSARAAGCLVAAVTNTYPPDKLRPHADLVMNGLPPTFAELDQLALDHRAGKGSHCA